METNLFGPRSRRVNDEEAWRNALKRADEAMAEAEPPSLQIDESL